MDKLYIYTDGSSKGNPGVGGWGVVMKFDGRVKELSGGDDFTTNNRMELRAVIMGLEAINRTNTKIVIHSDSMYVINAFVKKWVFNWEKDNYKGKKNSDLFKILLELYRRFESIEFLWVKGHSGHEENENCDSLAVAMSLSKPQTEDDGYEG